MVSNTEAIQTWYDRGTRGLEDICEKYPDAASDIRHWYSQGQKGLTALLRNIEDEQSVSTL